MKEVAAHEDKVEGLKKEVRRQAREASQMEKKVRQFTYFSPKITLVIDNSMHLSTKRTQTETRNSTVTLYCMCT